MITLRGLLMLAASLTGCGSAPLAAVVPVFADRSAELMSLEGTVETIQFQNINKAQGRYTYNVEVRVRHEGISESPHGADLAPGEFRVRVHKVYWSQLGEAEQAAIAPGGPEHTMSVDRWRGYVVGQQVTLEVGTWGPGRGALPSPAPDLPTSPAR